MWKMESEKMKFIHKVCKSYVLSAGGSIVCELAISSGEPRPPPFDKCPLVTSHPFLPYTHPKKEFPESVRVDKREFHVAKKMKWNFKHQWNYSKEPRCWALCFRSKRHNLLRKVAGLASNSVFWWPWDWNISFLFFLKTISYKSC